MPRSANSQVGGTAEAATRWPGDPLRRIRSPMATDNHIGAGRRHRMIEPRRRSRWIVTISRIWRNTNAAAASSAADSGSAGSFDAGGLTPTSVSVIATLPAKPQLSVLGHLHRSSDTPGAGDGPHLQRCLSVQCALLRIKGEGASCVLVVGSCLPRRWRDKGARVQSREVPRST